jgi:transposase
MILNTNVITEIEIRSVEDLHKLEPMIKEGVLKVNKSQIARELGKDRRTVDKYLNGYAKPARRNKKSKIDEFHDMIVHLLSDETKQVFYYKRVLWQYLTDNHGLECAESSFRRYISQHMDLDNYFKARRPAVSSSPCPMRFETEAGRQAQVDWKERLEILLNTGETVVVNIFVLLLSYSRFRIYRLSLSKSQETLLTFMDDAFEAIGGVPEEILTDNMKTVMDESRTENYKGKVNLKFQQFAADYGFQVKPCIAGRPRTKGKAEAPMKLLDELFAYNGQLDYAGLVGLVERINNRVNSKASQGTGRIPLLYLQKERDAMMPLPPESIRKGYRIVTSHPKVNASSMISHKSSQYSVPPGYMGKRLSVQAYDGHLHIYHGTDLIAIHGESRKKLNYLESHYVSITGMTMNDSRVDITEMAKENLRLIGEAFKDEQHLHAISPEPGLPGPRPNEAPP